MRHFTVLTVACMSALLLAGCSSFSESLDKYKQREESLTNVSGDIWQAKAVWPWEENPVRLREHMYDKARQHCSRQQYGAQMLECASAKRKNGPGTEAVLIFRCVHRVKGPEKPFIDHSQPSS
ncbi:MAG: hypothetical protein IJ164_02915 [Duodenibacillus sp.]|nr:hypothetical protein [Duodenibacillus sp.]